MAIDPKILKRIRALSAMADENRNSSQHEREVAALECLRLIRQHNVPVGNLPLDEDERPKKRKKPTVARPATRWESWTPPKRTPSWAPEPEPDFQWHTDIADRRLRCSFCKQVIQRGERIHYMVEDHSFVIHDWPCVTED